MFLVGGTKRGKPHLAVGAILKAWRGNTPWSQDEVAARISTPDEPVSRERYSTWERGVVMPPLEYRLRLAKLGCTGLPGVPYNGDSAERDNTTPEQIALMIDMIFDEQTDRDRKARARRELYRVLRLPETAA